MIGKGNGVFFGGETKRSSDLSSVVVASMDFHKLDRHLQVNSSKELNSLGIVWGCLFALMYPSISIEFLRW